MTSEFYNREKFKCPDCGEYRFNRMINEKGEFYPDDVGRCDRENSCGYIYHASQYLKDHPDANNLFKSGKISQPKRRIINGFYSFDIGLFELYRKSALRSNEKYLSWDLSYTTAFQDYLVNIRHLSPGYVTAKMDEYLMYEQVELYYEGLETDNSVLKCRTSVLYHYISQRNDIRAIEQIFYNGFKRSKTVSNRILNRSRAEVNQRKSQEQIEGLEINWCLFGEHLLPKYPEKVIIVVEGVKTAFGMALYYPQYNWLATGSSTRLIHLNFTTNQKVYFLPDAGLSNGSSYCQRWSNKIKNMYGVNFAYVVYDFNQDCTSIEISDGIDILDIQLKDPIRAQEILSTIMKL